MLRFTSDVDVSVLGYVFESRYDSVHDVFHFEVGHYLFELVVGDAPDFRLDVVQVLDVVRQEGLEVVLSHRCS